MPVWFPHSQAVNDDHDHDNDNDNAVEICGSGKESLTYRSPNVGETVQRKRDLSQARSSNSKTARVFRFGRGDGVEKLIIHILLR